MVEERKLEIVLFVQGLLLQWICIWIQHQTKRKVYLVLKRKNARGVDKMPGVKLKTCPKEKNIGWFAKNWNKIMKK